VTRYGLRRFWRVAWDSNVTGMASMLAYNMLLSVIPLALLALFVAGQVLSSHAVQGSVLNDLQEVFKQKRFALSMLIVVLVFMIATVAVPAAQSILRAGADQLPFDLAHVAAVVYAGTLALSLAVLFGCLSVIYARAPHLDVPWRAVWPGALGATVAIGIIDYAFPAYLNNISTIARFGTTIVFVLITLGWFYVLALIILAGGIVNSLRLDPDRQ
jgi:membrane protein